MRRYPAANIPTANCPILHTMSSAFDTIIGLPVLSASLSHIHIKSIINVQAALVTGALRTYATIVTADIIPISSHVSALFL